LGSHRRAGRAQAAAIDAEVKSRPIILAELDSLPLPARGGFTTKGASGKQDLGTFIKNHSTAIDAIMKNQLGQQGGLLRLINDRNLAHFGGAKFDEGQSAHHFFTAEIAHELMD
jgi:hypothetical protein